MFFRSPVSHLQKSHFNMSQDVMDPKPTIPKGPPELTIHGCRLLRSRGKAVFLYGSDGQDPLYHNTPRNPKLALPGQNLCLIHPDAPQAHTAGAPCATLFVTRLCGPSVTYACGGATVWPRSHR